MLVACPKCQQQYDVSGAEPGAHFRCHCGQAFAIPQLQGKVAKSLHCSSCGAAVGHEDKECGYCGNAVADLSALKGSPCPHCMTRLVPNASFCAGCGSRIAPEKILTEPVATECPRCQGQMVLRRTQAGQATFCTQCDGLWISEDSFTQVLTNTERQRREKAAESAAPSMATSRNQDGGLDTSGYLPCLVCGNLMNRKNFARYSGVLIDWCRDHGYWFDGGELDRIMEFVKEGGLEDSKRTAAERKRAHLANERFSAEMDYQRDLRTQSSSNYGYGSYGGYSPQTPIRRRRPNTDVFDVVGGILRGFWD